MVEKKVSADYNEAKNMLHVLQVSCTTECIPPVQNALEFLTPQIWMTSGGDKLCKDHRITEWVMLEETS